MKSEFHEYALGDITELVIDYRGKTPLKLGADWSTSGYRALSAKNIKTGRIVQEDPVYGSGGIMRYVERPIFERESVLIPRKGTLNNVMYVNQPFWSVDTMFYTEMKLPNVAKYVYHFVKAKDLASMNPTCVKNIFSVKILRRILSDAVHKAAQYAVRHETVFRQQLQAMSVQIPSEEKQLKKAAASAGERIGELNRLLKKLYEDYALEHIDEANYQRLSLAYEQELSETEQELNQLQEHISMLQESNNAADQFLELAKQYCDASSLTDEELSLFVDKVLVYETQKDADGERTRRLDIHFSFIEEFHVPSEPVILSAEEQKHQEELKKRRIHARNKRAEKRRMREAEQMKHDVV